MPVARVGAVDIAFEAQGEPEAPVVLLIAGLGRQLIMWPPRFVHAITIDGFRVMRLDNRDVGLSSHFAGKVNLSEVTAALRRGTAPDVPYVLADMAGDVVGLLDHLGVDSAHLVGVSMGGAIAQQMAIDRPARVRSLTSIMGTTGAAGVGQPNATGNRALYRAPPADREGAIASVVAAAELLATKGCFDLDWERLQAGWAYDRAFDPEGVGRQLAAIWAGGDRTATLPTITAPALVIHGAADPLVQVSGGRATAAAIPGAAYVEIGDMAHDLPERWWPLILGELLAHLAAAEAAHRR